MHHLYGSRPQTKGSHKKYQEGQVDYFVKKGMSLLVIMEIKRKADGGVSVFEYSFAYYVIKRYSGQDYLQVAAVIHLAVYTVQD